MKAEQGTPCKNSDKRTKENDHKGLFFFISRHMMSFVLFFLNCFILYATLNVDLLTCQRPT